MSLADTINTWFAERIACGAIARDTDAYNQARVAKNDLIALLDPPAPAPATESVASAAADPAPAPADPAADPAA